MSAATAVQPLTRDELDEIEVLLGVLKRLMTRRAYGDEERQQVGACERLISRLHEIGGPTDGQS